MKTVFIGFTRKVGSFTNRDTGELVEYNNRELRFITDSAPNSDVVGFSSFSVPKMKLEQIAQILKVQKNDEAVDNALKALISQEVNTQFAPVGDSMSLVWFSKV